MLQGQKPVAREALLLGHAGSLQPDSPWGLGKEGDMNEETQPVRTPHGFVTLVPEPWELHLEWKIGSHLLKKHRCFCDFQSKPRT